MELVGARGIPRATIDLTDHDSPRRAAGTLRLMTQRMTRRSRHAAEPATDREVGVVAAILVAGSEKAAAQRSGPVALDGEAPSGERPIEDGGDDDGPAGVDPGSAAAGA
jgi:hypothetical protein